MTIKKQFENITIQEFEEKYRQDVVNFELSERQQIYSSLPKSVLDDALSDSNRVANIAINEYGDVVGFFVLHQYYQHEGYDTPENVVYVRSLSINEKFQGNGYGTTMMMYLPQYVQDLFPDFNHLYLVVDAENKGAWNVYERAGFMHTATKEEGPIGKERLYYLDLDSRHVSSLRLTENEASSISSYSVVDLLKDNHKVGFIALEQTDNRINIVAIEVYKEQRKEGIAESALRQIPTYVRKHFKQAKTIMITLFGENNELKSLCVNSGFVEIDQSDDLIIFEKYVNY
ncbi:GNAT family N-acetyltransferase [Staphylococcus haemolyticus]|uniref:GNAT family N-acetyltransferase n=1 Tax=Staphylococcus TaxID=1279 RepID=UPI00069E8095|nr:MULTISPECIES: GNAT family N-acetyltransferase [Staphylococcus]KAA2278263.1 GNAT family N-acetyltransferase [Staphylococcus sp. GDX7P312P]KAA2281330.1 GNAT family N-acetyltransferase [Staphylococcus sp. GDX7P459A]MBE7357003.1 GNAT family N-acetyltransferase [Staphylococcus haemolyticus]MCE4955381.1 GNAT family N-acetyltransferase [Staphylococcus haemolyticus]MDT0706544.1 GNAT family N-acetyltransferase [Staphylococcus haemolyticus]